MPDTVSQFMSEDVVVLKSSNTAYQAACAMKENEVGCILIVDKDSKELAGVLTDRDLVCNLATKEQPKQTPLTEYIVDPPFFLTANSPLDAAVDLMKREGIRRIPIVDRKKPKDTIVGILTLDDLILAHAVSPQNLGLIIRAQLYHNRRRASAQRAESRKEQTIQRFWHEMSESMALPIEQAKPIAHTLFEDIVQRLPYRSAIKFLAPLPENLKEDLLDLPAGPNRDISAQVVIDQMQQQFQIAEDEIPQVLRGFWSGVERFTRQSEPETILGALPDDFRNLFESEAHIH